MSNDQYKILKELINQWIEREEENYDEAKVFGVDCAGAAMALGALDAYNQVLSDIASLEQTAVLTD